MPAPPIGPILIFVHLELLANISWAYRLHYYICFRTYRRRELFQDSRRSEFVSSTLSEVCSNHEAHLIRHKVYPNHVRVLISLRPDQAVSKSVQTVKANLSSQFTAKYGDRPPIWARGYLARSVGQVGIDAVRRYLTAQAEHHGYAARKLPPVFRYRAESPVKLESAHATFDLNYHLVFSTSHRAGIFSSEVGREIAGYWLRVAEKRAFAIDQISFVPDHVHLFGEDSSHTDHRRVRFIVAQ